MRTMDQLNELTGEPALPLSINQLRGQRAELVERMKGILQASERRNTDLTDQQTAEFRELDVQVEDLTARIEAKQESERSAAVAAATQTAAVGDWPDRAAVALREMGGETRAVVSGSVDVPALVRPDVIGDPYRPDRLVDLLVNREAISGNAYSYVQQTVRTGNADVVADAVSKPTSLFTIAQHEDRARVIAHLSEPVPLRIMQDHRAVRDWLAREMREGVLDALETQIVNGDGTGENITGITATGGITTQAFDTDMLTSLRKGRTALELLHEQPTAWVLHPSDWETVDLEREGASGGFLSRASDIDPVFGTYQRVASTSVPQGTALLADWTQVRIYLREGVRLDTDLGGTLFDTNQLKLRAEMRAGIGVLRPQAFCTVALASAG